MLSGVEGKEVNLAAVDNVLNGKAKNAVDQLYKDHGDIVHDWIEHYCMDEEGELDLPEGDSLENIAFDAGDKAYRRSDTVRGKLEDVCDSDAETDLALGYFGQRGVNNGEGP